MGQSCSQDHDSEATELNEAVLHANARLRTQKEAFESFQSHHLNLEAQLRKEIQDLEITKGALTRDIEAKDKEIEGHLKENEALQDLISKVETELAQVQEDRQELNLQLRDRESELSGAKYKREREAISKMKTEAKRKKTELKAREKAVAKREHETARILERETILEKRIEECSKRESAVEAIEEAQKQAIQKHMLNVKQNAEMKKMLAQMNSELASRKEELKDIEEMIRLKEERANVVLRKESDIKRKHSEIRHMHEETEKGIVQLRDQLTAQRQTQSNLLERQKVVEATARINEEEREEIERQKKLILLEQSDLARMEEEIEEKKKTLAKKESEIAKREEAVDEEEAEIEVMKLAMRKMDSDSRTMFEDSDSEGAHYYQSKTNLFREKNDGAFKVKGDQNREAIQTADKSNLYAQMYSVQKASEKLSGIGSKKDPGSPTVMRAIPEAGGGVMDSEAPKLPPRPPGAPTNRSSKLIAPPNLPHFDA